MALIPVPAQRFSGRSGRTKVLVIGGSQGAKALNERMPEALRLMPESRRPQVRHQAGRTLDIAQDAYAQAGVVAEVSSFIDDMAAAYAWADLVVCRAGASTIAELAAAGCASLLVPFPAAVDDHQTRNGEYLVRAGAAVLIQECDLSAARLAQALDGLLEGREKLLTMAEAARSADLAAGDAIHRAVSRRSGGCMMQSRRFTDTPMRRVRRIHMIGIGGSGMAGIAEVLLNLGYAVSGSDLKDSAATQRLKKLGARIRSGHVAKSRRVRTWSSFPRRSRPTILRWCARTQSAFRWCAAPRCSRS